MPKPCINTGGHSNSTSGPDIPTTTFRLRCRVALPERLGRI